MKEQYFILVSTTITIMRLLSFSFLLLIVVSKASAQQPPAKALEKLYLEYPEEKIYVWFNKPAYVAGETIWFKAYTFNGYQLSQISTTFYVELYDVNKKLISNKLFPLLNGAAAGSIDLDAKTDEGIYYIRAYTQWMLNFDESLQYIHQLLVYNPESKKHLEVNKDAWKAGAFPEGGSLIDGIEAKVAVRRFASHLANAKWSGYLYDESSPSVKIEEFNSLDENVALFSFIPEAGKKYLVNVSDEYGNKRICSLPAVKTSGVSFSVESVGNSIVYDVRFQNIPGNGNGYSIVGEIQHQLAYQATFKNSTGSAIARFPTDELGNGILHLTVFDPTNNPVAERLVFVNPYKLDYDNNTVAQYNLSAASRSASDIQLRLDSISWLSYSVSVTEETAPTSLEEENILSALWLTSDIASPVQNSCSYFREPDKNKIDALDAIMISENWKRFKWTDILNNKYPTISYIPINFLSYTGRVKIGNKLKPNEEVTLLFYYPDSSTRPMLTQTNAQGDIVIDSLVFYDDAKVFYQLNNNKGNAKLIDINFERNNRFVPYTSAFPETSYTLSSTDSKGNTPAWVNESINNLKQQKTKDKEMLEEVIVQSKLKTPKEKLNEQLVSPRFQTTNETVFDFVNEKQTAFTYLNILQWLNGRVAGLNVLFQNGSWVPYIRGTDERSLAAIFVDEMRVDPSFLDGLSVNDIALVKVIKGSAYALQAGVVAGGIIAIYTNRMGVRTAQKEPPLPSNKISGYNTVKKFFLPDYSDKTISHPLIDARTQLLWQTLIVPDTSGVLSRVQFFNNDKARQFRVTVQGFTSTGFPVYYDKITGPGQKSF